MALPYDKSERAQRWARDQGGSLQAGEESGEEDKEDQPLTTSTLMFENTELKRQLDMERNARRQEAARHQTELEAERERHRAEVEKLREQLVVEAGQGSSGAERDS